MIFFYNFFEEDRQTDRQTDRHTHTHTHLSHSGASTDERAATRALTDLSRFANDKSTVGKIGNSSSIPVFFSLLTKKNFMRFILSCSMPVLQCFILLRHAPHPTNPVISHTVFYVVLTLCIVYCIMYGTQHETKTKMSNKTNILKKS